ncbi:MAG TPA: SDR family NAD(P)-dependent oxidoreductase [Terriglobales bacterium]
MNLELDGKRALVTGSTAGIGYAIAEALAREGADVIVNGRTEERVKQAIQSIWISHPQAKVEGLAADLGKADGVRAAVQRLLDVDILVNTRASSSLSRLSKFLTKTAFVSLKSMPGAVFACPEPTCPLEEAQVGTHRFHFE